MTSLMKYLLVTVGFLLVLALNHYSLNFWLRGHAFLPAVGETFLVLLTVFVLEKASSADTEEGHENLARQTTERLCIALLIGWLILCIVPVIAEIALYYRVALKHYGF